MGGLFGIVSAYLEAAGLRARYAELIDLKDAKLAKKETIENRCAARMLLAA